MRRATLFYTVLVFVAGAAISSAAEVLPHPRTHEEALINTFEVMCNLELPNFDHLSARATAMRMQPQIYRWKNW